MDLNAVCKIFAALPPVLLLHAVLSACGVEVGNPKKPGGGQTTQTSFVLNDFGLATSVISAQADTVSSALSREAAAPALALDNPMIPVPGRTMTCAPAADGTFLVQLRDGGDLKHQYQRRGHRDDFQDTDRHATTTERWSQAPAAITCDGAKADVIIDWSKADNLALDTELAERHRLAIVRGSIQGVHQRQSNSEISGQRHDAWKVDPVNSTASVIALEQTITGFVDKFFTAQPRSGGPVNIATHAEIDPNAPLLVQVLRDKATQAWQSKTVQSGKLLTTQGLDARIETVYSNVVFAKDAGCVPVAGTISGTIFRGDDGAVHRSFVIDFTQGIGTISYNDGTLDTYVPDYCAFDGQLTVTGLGL